MKTVQEALSCIKPWVSGETIVDLDEALGRVLFCDYIADRDFPPFNRVAMDGVAIAFDSFDGGQITFEVQTLVAAGQPEIKLQRSNVAVEVMTGAVLPLGCDTVIRYEDIILIDGIAEIVNRNISQGQNIHSKGSDKRVGEVILHKGGRINIGEIGILASLGIQFVSVESLPEILILCTGDELVPLYQTPSSYQIRMSNGHSIKAILKSWNVSSKIVIVGDDQQLIFNEIERGLKTYSAVIVSGGVSKGKLDFVPDVLTSCKVDCIFHGVLQKPGKPMWYGVNDKQVAVFALPGNPVSSIVCTLLYVGKWLGRHNEWKKVVLNTANLPNSILTRFLPVHLNQSNTAELVAIISSGKGSGDMIQLIGVDGFAIIPPRNEDTPSILTNFLPIR